MITENSGPNSDFALVTGMITGALASISIGRKPCFNWSNTGAKVRLVDEYPRPSALAFGNSEGLRKPHPRPALTCRL